MFLYILFSAAFQKSPYLLEDSITFTKASGDYANNNYVNSHKITKDFFTFSSNGDKDGHPLSNALDGSNNFWVAKEPNTDIFHNTITIDFDKEVIINAIIHDATFNTLSNRIFHGFPLKMKVFSAMKDDDPFRLQATFSGNPGDDNTWSRTQFVFNNAVRCKRLQIEFVEVTPNNFFSGGALVPFAQNIYFIGELQHYESTFSKASYNYAVADYVNSHKVKNTEFTYETNGDKEGNPKTNLFDGNHVSYWMSSQINSDSFKASITIDFTETTSVEGIIYSPSYSTSNNVRTFSGFPYKLTVYTAMKNRQFTIHTVFEGTAPTETDWEKTQYIFPSLAVCDRMKIEFTEITVNAYDSNRLTANSGELELIKPETEGSLPFYPGSGQLSNNAYVTANKIPTNEFTFISNGDKNGKPLSYAFDGNYFQSNAYWVSNILTDTFKSSVYITFNRMAIVNCILNFHAYSKLMALVDLTAFLKFSKFIHLNQMMDHMNSLVYLQVIHQLT